MSDLLDEAASEPVPPIQCGNCGQTLPGGSVVCVACGYNLRTRQKMSMVVERPDEESKAAAGVMKAAGAAGSFVLGVSLCSVAVGIGMALWFVIAIVTNREFGIAAWGLGVLAGVGMRVGYRKEDDIAGITAAIICLVALVGSKWMLFSMVFMPIIQEAAAIAQEAEDPGNGPPQPIANPQAVATDPAASESGESAVGEEESAEEGMADEGTIDATDTAVTEEEQLELDLDPETAAELQELSQKSTSALFFVTMIGPWGIVFILLAFFTAYRVGTGGPLW